MLQLCYRNVTEMLKSLIYGIKKGVVCLPRLFLLKYSYFFVSSSLSNSSIFMPTLPSPPNTVPCFFFTAQYGPAYRWSLALEQFVHPHADFVLAAEARAQFLAVEVLHRLVIVRPKSGTYPTLLGQLGSVAQVIGHELLDLGLGQGLLSHVDEDRTRKRLVGAIHHSRE